MNLRLGVVFGLLVALAAPSPPPPKGPIKHLYVTQHKNQRFVIGGQVVPQAMTVVVLADTEDWHRSSVVHTVDRKVFEIEWWVPKGAGSGTAVDVVVVAFDAENRPIDPDRRETLFLRWED